MIVGKRKPFEEITGIVDRYAKVLNVGCGTCVAVCLAGGEREVELLSGELELARKAAGRPLQIDQLTVERQCDREYLAELDEKVANYEAVISMACGAGVQFLAERFPDTPVYPAVDTEFIGVNQGLGWFEERCRSCSSCLLGVTGGICPVTLCAKSLFNGPCGGTNGDSCEVDEDQPCAWHAIYKRLSAQDRLDAILEYHPVREHKNGLPRQVVQPGYEKPAATPDS